MARKTLFERMAGPGHQAIEPLPLPAWFDESLHRVEPRGIVLAASGDLLAEDGLPVNAAARAALAQPENPPAEAPAAQPE